MLEWIINRVTTVNAVVISGERVSKVIIRHGGIGKPVNSYLKQPDTSYPISPFKRRRSRDRLAISSELA